MMHKNVGLVSPPIESSTGVKELTYLQFHKNDSGCNFKDPIIQGLLSFIRCELFAGKGTDATETIQFPSNKFQSELFAKLGFRGKHFDVAFRAAIITYFMRNFEVVSHHEHVKGILSSIVDAVAGQCPKEITAGQERTTNERRSLLESELNQWLNINKDQKERLSKCLRDGRGSIVESWFSLLTLKPESILLDSARGRTCFHHEQGSSFNLNGEPIRESVLSIPAL